MSKKLSKYISFFYYFYKSLIVLSVTISSLSIASFATVIGIPIGITSASLVCGACRKIIKSNKK